jgi:hypothetical protein
MGAAGGVTVKTCITKEMAERNDVPAQSQGNCKTTNSPMSGNTMKMSFTCSNPPSSGDGVVTFVSPQSYTVKMAITTSVQGKPEKINTEGAGQWLGADCGGVKPPVMPK